MCKLKSGIILKDRIFIPDYDSHNKMLEELGIEDTRKNAKRLFIRAELFPVNDDVFTPISEWQYKVDQDITPDWYVPDYDEKRMRDAVAEWAEEHILIGVKGKTLNSLQNIYLKDCVDITCGNSTVKAYSNSTVRAYDNSTVTACDNSTVTAYGDSTVVIPSWSSNKRKNIVLEDNSTLKDCKTKTIYQSGDWELVHENV